MLDKRDAYIKNVQSEYKDLYVNKGINFCKDIHKRAKSTPKKNFKVKFSDNIQYSMD